MVSISKRLNEDFEIRGKIYALDSSTIDLIGKLFGYFAFMRKRVLVGKGEAKIHTLFSINTQIPVINITSSLVNDMNGMNHFTYEEST